MDNENEVLAVNRSLMPQAGDMVSLEKTVQNAERYFNALGQIRKLSVNLTNVFDWVNEAGKPYLQKSGCDKIAGAFGVQTESPIFEKEFVKDEKGDYYIYTCTIAGRWNTVEASEIGVASSRDDFFAMKSITNEKGEKEKVLKPQSEVDPCDIRKKALTNGMNRLVKRLLGLSFTWEDIKEISAGKITPEACAGVSYAKGSRGGNADSPDTKNRREECRKWILEMCDGEENRAKEMCADLTKFIGRDGPVAGKQNVNSLSEKQVDILHKTCKKMVEDYRKTVAAAGSGPEL